MQSEKRKGFFRSLGFDALIFIVTTAISVGLSFYTQTKPNASYDYKTIIDAGILYSVTLFISAEMVRILVVIRSFEDEISAKLRRSEIYNGITHVFLKAFEIKNDFIREIVLASLENFPDAVRFGEFKVELQSNNLGFDVYQNFWRKLIQVQKSNPSRKIVVRATHSASIDLWETQTSFIGLQREFCQSGGTLYRILIRNNDISGGYDDYSRLAHQMRSLGVNVFFLDASKSPVFHDYLRTHPQSLNLA